MLSGTAFAGSIDWCFSQIGYSPEITLIETQAKFEVAKIEIQMLSQFNRWVHSMITSANLTTIGSFGIAFLLAGIFIDKSRSGLRALRRKVFIPISVEPEPEQ